MHILYLLLASPVLKLNFGTHSLTCWIQGLSRTCGMKFNDFQAPVLFSSTFKALNLGENNSSTFKDFQGCVGTLVIGVQGNVTGGTGKCVLDHSWILSLELHCFKLCPISSHTQNYSCSVHTFAVTKEVTEWQMIGNESTRSKSRLVLQVDVGAEVNQQSSYALMLLHCSHV